MGNPLEDRPRRSTTASAAPSPEHPGAAPAGDPDAGARPASTASAAQSGTTAGALSGAGLSAGFARLRAGLARARCLWRDFTGESAYDRYVERHRRNHPDHEPMSERQWWRARAEHDERSVSTGCC